jgi:arginine exporter protein ArgO
MSSVTALRRAFDITVSLVTHLGVPLLLVRSVGFTAQAALIGYLCLLAVAVTRFSLASRTGPWAFLAGPIVAGLLFFLLFCLVGWSVSHPYSEPTVASVSREIMFELSTREGLIALGLAASLSLPTLAGWVIASFIHRLSARSWRVA